MYLKDLFQNPEENSEFTNRLNWLADLTEDSVKELIKVYAICEQTGVDKGGWEHATILALVRHICESVDGVAVLVRAGCSLPSQPLLRSALEAAFGVRYILEKDSEQRALAYQAAHAHHQIKFYRSLDPDDPLGKQTIEMMKHDPVASRFSLPKEDYKGKIANLVQLLQRPHFAPIEAEWQRMEAKKRPFHWYGLFEGPRNVRELAIHLKIASAYDFLYRTWSNAVHAGDCLRHFSGDGKSDTAVTMRPLRHPEQLQTAVSIGCGIVLELARILVDCYGTAEQQNEFGQRYVTTLQKRLGTLRKVKLLDMNWR